VVGIGAREEGVCFSGFEIGFRSVGEREHVHWEEEVEELLGIARCLAETVVERAAAGATRLIDDAIEDAASCGIFIEAFVKEMAQETPTLGDAPAIGPTDAAQRISRRVRVLQEADEIARAGEATP